MKKKSTYKAKKAIKTNGKPKAKAATLKLKAAPNAKYKATQGGTVADNKKQGANKPLAKQQSIKKAPVKAPIKGSNNVRETYPHFRRYKKSNHPALIVGEQIGEQQKEEYKYRKVMHGERDGDRLNEKVYPNPNPKDPKPMYIGKRTRHDEKNKFKEPLPWKYPKK